ncbi:MAG TPA: hypothetical protein VGK74_19545 [Symbiobacteriaceae bacterium]
MVQYAKGFALSFVVNALTILGWYYIGMWVPAVVNVGLALVILGFYGLEDKWAFPGGYWTVELLSVVLWIDGMGALLQAGGSSGG